MANDARTGHGSLEYRGLTDAQTKEVFHQRSRSLYRHSMVLIEVHHGRLRTWAILHSRVYSDRELCRMQMPATTGGLHGVMLGHLKLQLRQIKDLTGLNHIGKGQFLMTGLTLVWYAVNNNFVGRGQQAHQCDLFGRP